MCIGAGSDGVVAGSGGVDAGVLLHALSQVADEFELVLDVVHLNHGLRGEASEGDQECVEGQAALLGLPCHTRRLDVGAAREGHASRTRPTAQDAALDLRLEAVVTLAVGQLLRRPLPAGYSTIPKYCVAC